MLTQFQIPHGVICRHFLRDSAAHDAAMPDIRVVLLARWAPGAGARAKGSPKVVTCIKLRHVQQLVRRHIASASSSLSQGVLRPSRRIVYDTHEALVCFLSDEVDGCMGEFKEEWESVCKIVVIVREGTSSVFLSF
jgi:mediator of RNA polymerase II transcription subunit 14